MNHTPAVATCSTIPATESFFEPRVVRSRLPACEQAKIEDAVADIKKRRARKRIEKTLSKASSPEGAGDDCVRAREARDAVQSFARSASWLSQLDAEAREDVLRLVDLRYRGLIGQADYCAGIDAAREAAMGPCIRNWSDTRPQAHPWRLPGGW